MIYEGVKIPSVTFSVYENEQYDGGDNAIPRRAMGALLVASQATFAGYASDLFFDYEWCQRHATPGKTFYWSHRDYGTSIGESFEAVSIMGDENIYSVTVGLPTSRGKITVEVSQLRAFVAV